MDLASIGIEAHSVKYTGNTEALSHIRNLIIANKDTRVIYFNALSGTEPMLRKFADSLTAIGRNVEVLEGFSTNDEILTPIAKQQIKEALNVNDYVIVNVAEPQQCIRSYQRHRFNGRSVAAHTSMWENQPQQAQSHP